MTLTAEVAVTPEDRRRLDIMAAAGPWDASVEVAGTRIPVARISMHPDCPSPETFVAWMAELTKKIQEQ